MPTFPQWFVPAVLGATFISIGGIRLYGALAGSGGGKDDPAAQRPCGP
jgi:hypothetical protein